MGRQIGSPAAVRENWILVDTGEEEVGAGAVDLIEFDATDLVSNPGYGETGHLLYRASVLCQTDNVITVEHAPLFDGTGSVFPNTAFFQIYRQRGSSPARQRVILAIGNLTGSIHTFDWALWRNAGVSQ